MASPCPSNWPKAFWSVWLAENIKSEKGKWNTFIHTTINFEDWNNVNVPDLFKSAEIADQFFKLFNVEEHVENDVSRSLELAHDQFTVSVVEKALKLDTVSDETEMCVILLRKQFKNQAFRFLATKCNTDVSMIQYLFSGETSKTDSYIEKNYGTVKENIADEFYMETGLFNAPSYTKLKWGIEIDGRVLGGRAIRNVFRSKVGWNDEEFDLHIDELDDGKRLHEFLHEQMNLLVVETPVPEPSPAVQAPAHGARRIALDRESAVAWVEDAPWVEIAYPLPNHAGRTILETRTNGLFTGPALYEIAVKHGEGDHVIKYVGQATQLKRRMEQHTSRNRPSKYLRQAHAHIFNEVEKKGRQIMMRHIACDSEEVTQLSEDYMLNTFWYPWNVMCQKGRPSGVTERRRRRRRTGLRS